MKPKKIALALAASAGMAFALIANVHAADYAIVLKTLASPYWVAMRDGIAAEARKRGVQADVFAAAGEDDITGQQRLLEDVVNKNYKAIGVAPISPVNLIQAMAAASKKGIYVVNIDERADMGQLSSAGGSVVAFLSTDNLALGEKAGGFILSKMGSAGGKVAIVEGKAGNASGDARRDGVRKALQTQSNVQLVASLPGDWDRSRALDVSSTILQRNPDLKAIYAANDTMALGALQAVKNANKLGKVLVIGTDGVPEAIHSVKQGELTATVAQDSAAMGAKALGVMIDTLKSRPVIRVDQPPLFIAVDSKIVSKD
ncbi:D-allose transporter substrate-binding protein [Verminephrobacter aporrectodeae subsp. tuberculatae]|uniref:D-allose transporter substrate-binding protein n=1 Tax=Verminephrobacter aporrectodeae TaxID=1110389 RepID=UPI0022383441|nr:D-allose transporter substrate-binding protein [Verminephrobacter aporrectodeae]MCW5222275.1 D-allose transporter substrate-binding protein [Verminephrobacter aporrectodeae subsp. tuberculatae]MCW5287739.1 D-allose transporter substrate-binding protein [Verminephrobacter aporrectodeae subsp. tuberculatae]MCW8165452.1 D-allose transporter substrate-binding protein [Verminephrobacter aporrectodeae subsp. tuberculatae]MCW8170020.1 D-allose transporter substrate-binding protein [Verminephrobacte